MPIWSDINGFPESGFPVLADTGDKICLGTLYTNPLKASNLQIDVVGNNRLLGALTLGGALDGVTSISMTAGISGVTSISMSSGLSGVTTISASGTVTLSGSTPLSITHQDAVLSMTGINASIGTKLSRIRRGYFTDLEVTNAPTVNGDTLVTRGELASYDSSLRSSIDSFNMIQMQVFS